MGRSPHPNSKFLHIFANIVIGSITMISFKVIYLIHFFIFLIHFSISLQLGFIKTLFCIKCTLHVIHNKFYSTTPTSIKEVYFSIVALYKLLCSSISIHTSLLLKKAFIPSYVIIFNLLQSKDIFKGRLIQLLRLSFYTSKANAL